jgi:quercetin dioxygenase-like cupin family protein
MAYRRSSLGLRSALKEDRNVPQPAPSFASPTTRTWVLRTAEETDGELYEQRVEYAPGSPFPPQHYHPTQRESFEVEAGAMVYVVAGEERSVSAGERLEIAAGTPHKARNASATEPAVVRWETRPALRSRAFYASASKLGRTGILDQALLAHEYRDVFRASGVLGAVMPLMAAVARLSGRRLPEAG